MTFTLKQLQEEQVPWVEHNFGKQPAYYPLLGIVEEVGELVVSIQGLEGRACDYAWSEIVKEPADALADITVYLCDFASALGIDMGQVEDRANSLVRAHMVTVERLESGEGWDTVRLELTQMMVYVGLISHHHLKTQQGIRGSKEDHLIGIRISMVSLLRCIQTLCSMLELDFIENTEAVWDEVKKRDWKKNKVSADVDARA